MNRRRLWMVAACFVWPCVAYAQAPDNVPPPPSALVDHLARITQFEQKQELMRKEMELMRTQIEFLHLKRDYELHLQRDYELQVDDLRLPTVVATWRLGAQAQALLRDVQGFTIQVSVGQSLSSSVRIARITDAGVWVEIKRGRGKKQRIEEVMLKAAKPAGMQQTSVGAPVAQPAGLQQTSVGAPVAQPAGPQMPQLSAPMAGPLPPMPPLPPRAP